MSVLVTGGAGYIGSATVEALRQRGESVVVYDNLSAGHPESLDASIPLVVGDIADKEKLSRLIDDHGVEEVIHFAAFTSVPESVAHPNRYFQNNTANALGLLDVMRSHGVSRFIFSSTAATYGEPQYNPIDEQHPTVPANPYGLSKRMVEQILETFEEAFGLRHVALRYFNACGGSPERGEDHTPETHLIPLVLQVALGQRKAISMFGDDYPTPDGTCVRDYVHVNDLAQAHLLALDHLRQGGESRKINLGNGEGYSVRQVIEAAREVTGHAIPAVSAPRRPGDPSTLVASSDLARQVLGWQPQTPDLREIIASAWKWHQAHPNGYAPENGPVNPAS